MAVLKFKPQLVPVPQGLASLPSPILFWQRDMQELWANDSFVEQFGPLERHHFDQNKTSLTLASRKITLNVLSREGRHEGYALPNKINVSTPVELRVSPYESFKNVYIIQIEDVTVRTELEHSLIKSTRELHTAYERLNESQNALIQSSKLASLGELSAGIAHELNQPLQAIMGFSQELVQIEKLSPMGMEFLNDIKQASLKMREIIDSLRMFARDAGEKLYPVHLEDPIKQAIKITAHTLMTYGLETKLTLEPNLPTLMANPVLLEQVFVNFINNAKDALVQAGKKNEAIAIAVTTSKKGTTKNIVVQIEDHGCGMTEATQQKIFDPFFTTKPIGKGTGLGMSISYGILKKLNCDIHVKSKVNQGTVFTLTFPTGNKTKRRAT